MQVKVEKLEKSRAKLTVDIEADVLEKAMEEAYRKNVKKINIPGFRKGKAPRKIIELNYGPNVFLEDAVDILLLRLYQDALAETEIQPVAQPDVDVEQIDPAEGATFTYTVDVYPQLELGQYKGLQVEREIVKITDESVDDVLRQEQDRNSQLVVADRTTVQEGDFAVIDFVGYVDGKPFSGGAGENHTLEVGAGTFIPGFEEQLVGFEVGVTGDIQVTFPEEYHAEQLAGQEATFTVTVKELKEKSLPEIDDEFVKDISEYETLDELKAVIRKNLEDEATRRTTAKVENRLLELIAEDSPCEIPQSMIDHQAEHIMEDYLASIARRGVSEEMYLEMTGQSREEIRASFEPVAKTWIMHDLILEAIREQEGITVSGEEVNEKIQEYLSHGGELTPEVEGRMREYWESQREAIEHTIGRTKTIQLIVDHAEITEVDAPSEAAEQE